MKTAVPEHIAIIMDGNGRWAQKRFLPRSAGHKKGAEVLKSILKVIQKKGVKYVTLFAFSSENWNRPKEEVDTLVGLFRTYLDNDLSELHAQKVKVSFIGERTRFPADIVQKMNDLEEKTKNHAAFHVILALSYGGKNDITHAVQKIAQACVSGAKKARDITEDDISGALSTAGIPNPDLVVRTSGEQRVSNFLLWEMAYSEFYFSPVFWPDFDEDELDVILSDYATRQRRYGKV
ncbi:MAG: isoprenyl transferase [Lactobacillales bacterium]|jgi:undecaprenyl diphosphate synthase|nr:isoprenyl transferase [Lactobacillales bacterium]